MPLYSEALGAHARDHRARDVRHQPVAHLRVDNLVGGICAHATGIRTLVVVEGALVVLRRYQRNHALAIAHHQERQLFAHQALFQYDAGTSVAEHLAGEHLLRDVLRFVFRLRDDNTLTGGQPVGFNDNGRMKQTQGFRQFVLAAADRVFCRGDVVPLHELLGEALARFQPGGVARGAEDRPAAPLEFVDHSQSERQLGTNDSEIGAEAGGELHQRVDALEIGGDAFGIGRDAAVARSAIQLLDPRRLPQLPDNRVFATTATEDEDLHGRKKRVGGRCGRCQTAAAGELIRAVLGSRRSRWGYSLPKTRKADPSSA